MRYTYGHRAHLVLVQVGPETGLVQVKKYCIVEDCVTILDQVIVDGQILGGAAQGIGNVLFEELKYDAEGQLLTGSLLDYLVPTVLDMPEFHIVHTETPAPFTPGGVKGIGEAGTIGADPAVANAVADAVLSVHVELTEPPVSPQAVWALINTNQAHAHETVTTPSQA
jgi:carbon-monoxide dehydrogenase large subunit